jgi:hypothetical protein
VSTNDDSGPNLNGSRVEPREFVDTRKHIILKELVMNGVKGYYQVNTETKVKKYREFKPLDYQAMGLSYAPLRGLPYLEAYQLVNRLNGRDGSKYRYYIAN